MDKSFYFALPLNEEAHRAMYGLENYLLDDHHPNAETVDLDCAIIVFPTDKQLQYRKEIQKEDFDESVQSNTEYYDMIREKLETVGIKSISTRAEYLRLIGSTKTWNLTLRKDYLPPWNLVFFTRDQGPKIVSPAEFGTEMITKYFYAGQKISKFDDFKEFIPGTKVLLKNEYGVVLEKKVDSVVGFIRWDTEKENDVEDWRGLFGTFLQSGGQVVDQHHKFKFIDDKGHLKKASC